MVVVSIAIVCGLLALAGVAFIYFTGNSLIR